MGDACSWPLHLKTLSSWVEIVTGVVGPGKSFHPIGKMITRSKLVEQLRESQIRSHHRWAPLILFSPKPQITNSADAIAALLWALLFCLIVVSAYLTLYFRYIRLSVIQICLGIVLHLCLKISRQRRLARKRERRLLLPLSM